MNHLEKTYWDMQKNSISYANDNKDIWSDISPINEVFELLVENEKKLSEAAKTQKESENSAGGHIEQKNAEIQVFAPVIYKISCKLSLYAKKAGDLVLLKKVNFPESALTAGEEKEIIARFESILDAAHEHLTDLELYKITAEELEGYYENLKKIKEMPDAISLLKEERKSATRIIKDLNSESRILLDQLDDGFEGFIDDEKFLDGWFDVRKIKGRRSGKKANGNGNTQNNDSKE